ncbi:hypothetical protein HanIR_Chr17g0882111 [Helianthus annuus]|nr:hypothetical protein HanIR_Chr17g0882111 [Helianthus annuus]
MRGPRFKKKTILEKTKKLVQPIKTELSNRQTAKSHLFSHPRHFFKKGNSHTHL